MERDPNELGALWEKSGKHGAYMTGTINGVAVVVFKNSRKANDKQPDWRVLKSQLREDRPAVTGTPEPPPDDSSIPF